MIWNDFLWIAGFLWVWIVPVVVLLSWATSNKQKAKTLNSGTIEFAPSKLSSCAWLLFFIYFLYAAVTHLKHSHGKPLDIFISACLGMLALAILASHPGTITVNADV